MKAAYLFINLASAAVPLLFSFHPRLGFARTWRAWLPALLLPAAVFIAWDVYYTHLGVWGFNPRYLLGIDLLGLPLEEWLFFLAIPYACLFTYACLKRLLPWPWDDRATGRVTLVLGLLFLGMGLLHLDRRYTGVTFLASGIFLLLYLRWSGGTFPRYFYPAYLVIYAGPFLLVNGLLTGTGLEAPIVWYDNGENLGLRVMTIPVEDFVYGFLLYACNVTVYEWRLKART